MDSCSSCGGSADVGAIYEAAMARRTMDQQRVDGADAVRLIEAAANGAGPAAARPLPADATISVRA